MKRKSILFILLISPLLFILLNLSAVYAQDEEDGEFRDAIITLSFSQTDTTYTAKATVMADTVPVAEKEVLFYVKRFYSLLPIGSGVETDENGEAIAEFPLDLHSGNDGIITVIARIEDDDEFGTLETQKDAKWGVYHRHEKELWGHRSLSAARDKAPTYLIIVSNAIIAIIWGTLVYVIFQIFRIKRAS
jgi:hypothetical protein